MKKYTILIIVLLLLTSACQQKQASQDRLLVEDAEEVVNVQDYDKARSNLLKAIEFNPRNLKAYVLLGDVYYFQSNAIMFRMQVLNLVFKYGRRLRWAAAKEMDLATPTEPVMLSGMECYQKALALLKEGVTDPTIEASYLNYELGWGYLAQDDLENAKKYFQESIEGGKDRWDVKSAKVYIGYLENKLIEKRNQEILEQARQKLLKKKEKSKE